MMSTDHLVTLFHELKLSSVVPSRVTAADKVHDLAPIDLATKVHYIRGLYFFNSDAVRGLDVSDLKRPMFRWLDNYAAASGRVRRSDTGRPLIKCNDSGVRIAEANCRKTVEEWVKDYGFGINDQLIYRHALGPDLGFSPLVFVQFTWFKCGGISVGLSWAHILGDAFSASAFINLWGQITAGHEPRQPPNMPNTRNSQFPPNPSTSQKPFSLKIVDPVGDYWIGPNSCKMETHSFHFTSKKLENIVSKTFGLAQVSKNKYFQFLTALMWKSLAKIRGESEPRVVTICSNDSQDEGKEISGNAQVVVIGTVEADFEVEKAELSELTKLIEEERVDERGAIDELVERENGKLDFILYGAKLTFVNWEDLEIYGLLMGGKKPVFANYSIAGVGDEGAIFVLPGPESGKGSGGSGSSDGRVVTAVLPENQVFELKSELRKEWGVF